MHEHIIIGVGLGMQECKAGYIVDAWGYRIRMLSSCSTSHFQITIIVTVMSRGETDSMQFCTATMMNLADKPMQIHDYSILGIIIIIKIKPQSKKVIMYMGQIIITSKVSKFSSRRAELV